MVYISKRLEKWGGSIPVALYLIPACAFLRLPGLYDDEAIVGRYALEIFRALTTADIGALPTGIHPYHGIVSSVLALPFLSLYTFSPVIALRICFVFWGALTVFLLYKVSLRLFEDKRSAVLCACLLATSPSFIMGTRLGAYSGSVLIFISMLAFYGLLSYLKTKKPSQWYLCMAMLGLGMSTFAYFIFPLVSIGVLALLYSAFGEGKHRRGVIWKGALFFFAGCCPLLLHIFLNPDDFWSLMSLRLAENASWQHWNPFLHWSRFVALFNGTAFLKIVANDYSSRTYFGNSLFPGLVAISLLILAAFSAQDLRNRNWKGSLAGTLLIWLGIFFLSSLLLPAANSYHHIFPILPFPQLCVAAAAWRLLRGIQRPSRVVVLGIIAAVSMNFVFDVMVMTQYYRQMTRTGGQDRFSERITDLTEWLIEESVLHPVVLTWGLANNLRYLSGLRIKPVELWEIRDAEGYRKWSRENLKQRQPVWLVEYANHAFAGEPLGPLQREIFREADYSCREAKRLHDRTGLLVLRAWECLSER